MKGSTHHFSGPVSNKRSRHLRLIMKVYARFGKRKCSSEIEYAWFGKRKCSTAHQQRPRAPSETLDGFTDVTAMLLPSHRWRHYVVTWLLLERPESRAGGAGEVPITGVRAVVGLELIGQLFSRTTEMFI